MKLLTVLSQAFVDNLKEDRKMVHELTHREERAVFKFLAKEFIEERLGLETSQANIRRLAAHLIILEKEIKQRAARKQQFIQLKKRSN